MSDTVERLAEKRSKIFGPDFAPDSFVMSECRTDARWWLLAIAEELEKNEQPESIGTTKAAIRWLRTQASEGE